MPSKNIKGSVGRGDPREQQRTQAGSDASELGKPEPEQSEDVLILEVPRFFEAGCFEAQSDSAKLQRAPEDKVHHQGEDGSSSRRRAESKPILHSQSDCFVPEPRQSEKHDSEILRTLSAGAHRSEIRQEQGAASARNTAQEGLALEKGPQAHGGVRFGRDANPLQPEQPCHQVPTCDSRQFPGRPDC